MTKAYTTNEAATIRATLRRAADGAPCLKCGCTEERACPGGCAWRTALLAQGKLICTRCTP